MEEMQAAQRGTAAGGSQSGAAPVQPLQSSAPSQQPSQPSVPKAWQTPPETIYGGFDPWQAYWIPWQDWAWEPWEAEGKGYGKKGKGDWQWMGYGKGKGKGKKGKGDGKNTEGKGQGKEMGKERGRAERGGKSPPLAWRTLRAGWRAGWIGF